MPERDRLVERARLEAAHPEAREDDVGVAEAGDPVRRGPDPEIEPADLSHPAGEPFDDCQAVGVEIDEDDLGAREPCATRDQ